MLNREQKTVGTNFQILWKLFWLQLSKYVTDLFLNIDDKFNLGRT